MTPQEPEDGRAKLLFAVDPQASTRADGDARADEQAERDPLDPLGRAAASAIAPLLSALEDAGPEAAEHLVTAAHEFSLAVKVMVDALERGLAEQREILATPAPAPAPAAGPSSEHPAGSAPSGVHRIDVE